MRLCIYALMISVPCGNSYAESPSEAYRKYVDQMIPLSFEYSKIKAGIQEHDVFINIMSSAQSELAQASELLNQVNEDALSLVSTVPSNPNFENCPKGEDGEVSNAIIFDNFSALNGLKRNLKQIDDSLRRYQSIKEQLPHACRGPFSRAFAMENDISVLTPEIHQWDGAYVSTGNLIQSLIEIGSTLFNFLSNQSEQSKINDEKHRFHLSRAKDRDFVRHSETACFAENELVAPAFQVMDSYLHSAHALYSEIKNIEWSRLSQFWRSCIQIDESEKIRKWVEATELEIRRQMSPIDASASLQILKIRLRRETFKFLSSNDDWCNPSRLKALESKLASFRVFKMQEEVAYLKLTQIHKNVSDSCDGKKT